MSNSSLFSSQWHRVRDVCPRLASDVTVSRHVYRGRTAYVLHRRATAACHRLDVLNFELIDRLDGEISVGQLWERAIVERDEDAPTQDEWIGLLAELHAAELIVVDRRVAEDRLFDQRQRHRVAKRRQRFLNPLYLRFALHDPDKWLNRLVPFARQVFSRSAGLMWLLLIIVAGVYLISHGDRLWSAMTDSSILSPENTLLFFLIYPPLKLLHEFAHALAVKRAGGEVHETGIALMVFLPLPYVDASAALSTHGGGLYPADENGDGRLLKEAVFDVELEWPESAGFAAVGSHVGVRLVYAPTPLSARLSTTVWQAIAGRVES